MDDYLIAIVSIFAFVATCLLMPLYLKPGRRLRRADHIRINAIYVVAYGAIGGLSALIFNKWGTRALLSYLACLVLVSLAIRLLFFRRKRPQVF